MFLTGHTGFKGTWLSLWLNQMGAKVFGYALAPNTNPSIYDAVGLKDRVSGQINDVRDRPALRRAMEDVAPDIVFHLAAQPLVRYSYQNPVETYDTNVMGTVSILDNVRRLPSVRAVVVVTSDKCYENQEWVWGYRENEPMGGYDPYSNSKGCAELVVSAFRQSYFGSNSAYNQNCAVASGRAGNVIGGGDWSEDRLVPDIVRAFSIGKSVEIRNPSAIRPWQHVLEPLSGYMLLAEKLYQDGKVHASGWNFGPRDTDVKPVETIVSRMAELWGEGSGWHLADGAQPHEARLLKLDCSKADAELGWQPRWNLEKTIQSIVAWHKADASGADMYHHCMAEIEEYKNS